MPQLTNQAAVALILNTRQDILLQKKDPGYVWHPRMWCFFGGQLKPGEQPLDTLVREVQEELGVPISDITFFKQHPYSDVDANGRERGGILYAYSAAFTGSLADIRLREGAGFAFFGREEIPTLPIVSHNKDLIMDYYRHLTATRTRRESS